MAWQHDRDADSYNQGDDTVTTYSCILTDVAMGILQTPGPSRGTCRPLESSPPLEWLLAPGLGCCKPLAIASRFAEKHLERVCNSS